MLETGANMVIFDNDLTPSQTRTLEDILKTAVLDRSALILDIFAQRAKTREGKLSGRAATVSVLSAPAHGLERGNGPSWRRHRHERPRRNAAGNR